MQPFFRTLSLVILFIFSFYQLLAQGTHASILGRITDDRQEAIIGATVQVKNESTGFTAVGVTSISGDYIVKQLPLGTPYTVTVNYVGYATERRTGFSLNQGNAVRVDFVLREDNKQLGEVVVVANSLKDNIDRLGGATSVSPNDMKVLPVNGRNFTSLTDLSPMSSGSNLAGQLYSSTSYTIDGMTAKSPLSSGTSNRGPYLVSMEAIREFAIVTNDYDVTLGRAGGGAISSVTKSGTNTLQGSAFVYHRADALSSKYDARGRERTDKYQITQYGFSLGGPIVKNRAHFFVSWDHQTDSRPLYIADIQSKEDEIANKITKENLDQFVTIAQQQYGVASSQQVGSFAKVRPSNSVFARIDWQLNPSNLLTIRNNFNYDINNLGISDNTAINLYEVRGTHHTLDNSVMANLRSMISPQLTNEVKVQYLHTFDDGRPNSQLPAGNIPRAIVEQVTSTIDGKEYKTNIQLGGQRYLPETFINDVYQLVDNIYYSTDKVDWTFGTDVAFTHLNSKATSEMNGRFYYRGMQDFIDNRPYRYAREVPVGDPTVKQGVLAAGLYAQAKFKPFKGGEITAGLRGDYTIYISNPNDDPLLRQELQLSTTNTVASLQLQPRVQFTWDINDRHTDVIRLGAGIFGSNLNNYSMVNNLQFDGQRVVAFDRSVTPGQDLGINSNFEEFRRNPSSIPGVELFEQFNTPKVATYNVNSAHTKVPTTYKMNLSYNRFFTDKLRVGAAFYATLGRNNYMYLDRNMVDEPFFRLPNEGNRGIYVPVHAISSKGTMDWTKGKKSDNIGRVLELVSEGTNNTFTAVADATWKYFRDGQITASYTWNDSRDNTSYNGNVANTATLDQMVIDDPRDLSVMNYSNGAFRHKVVLFGTAPSFYGISVGVRFSGMGGRRYSMAVNGNMNGDFVSTNDLAFVFDPSSPNTPENMKTGINDLLNNPEVDNGFKDYLRSSFGKVAQRNGGINGFFGTCDIRIAKNFKLYRTHGLEVSFDLFNVANLFNKKWGVSRELGKQNLYSITGFNSTTKEFTYAINPAAGIAVESGNPWQMQLGLRYAF